MKNKLNLSYAMIVIIYICFIFLSDCSGEQIGEYVTKNDHSQIMVYLNEEGTAKVTIGNSMLRGYFVVIMDGLDTKMFRKDSIKGIFLGDKSLVFVIDFPTGPYLIKIRDSDYDKDNLLEIISD